MPGFGLTASGQQSTPQGLGTRVGVAGVLDDLDRRASLAHVPCHAPAWGFRWDDEDDRTQDWFPQGITTSADAADSEVVGGRRVVCTSWYSHSVDGASGRHGSRVSFVDVTDPARLRYRHVLLVQPSDRGVLPVPIHAGGLVWHGPYLHVAGTARGVFTFRLDDITRVPGGRGDYVLPLAFRYDAVSDPGVEPLRYSFLSLDRSPPTRAITAGEYGRKQMTTRLVGYEIDPATYLLRTDGHGRALPHTTYDAGLHAMQGAVVVDDRYYVTTSAGRHGRGSLWVGLPGSFRRLSKVLPAGPEDICYWPSTGQLWSLTEYPGHRYVFAMNRAELSGD